MIDLAPAANDLVRLHITPFNPDIYNKNIPAALRKPENKVSFHAVQTFPERGFGYLELTKADADILKRKLQSAMLKGTKVRIEEARPMKKRKSETMDEPATKHSHKERFKTEAGPHTKARDVVLPGYELSADRHVKRGWTEDKRAKSTAATADKKLLFKTKVPANLTKLEKEKSKKPKEKRAHKAKKGETIVEEFAKTRSTFAVSQATSADRKPAVAYEDGLGWVDEDGQVVEAESKKLQRQHKQPKQSPKGIPASAVEGKGFDTGENNAIATDQASAEVSNEDVDMESESQSSPDDDSASGASESSESQQGSEDGTAPNSLEQSETSSNAGSTDEHESTTDTPEIHPLEALYKRSADRADAKNQLAPINTSFSFFEAADEAPEDASMIQPQTPHTKQDLEWRHQRSAAPTPDTAAIDGRFGFPLGDGDSDEDKDEDLEVTPRQSVATTQQHQEPSSQQESAFRRYFYEKRGETDRAWKKRRREAKKLQRQRENRRSSRRVV